MRIRTIKPEFWQHEILASLPEFARLLAIALLNYADDDGYFLASPQSIRGGVFPFMEDSLKIQGALTDLSRIGYVELGRLNDGRAVGRVVKFRDHQVINRPQASKFKGSSTFTEYSLNAHGVFTESSLNAHGSLTAGMEGNGREEEGKGKEKKGKETSNASSIPQAMLQASDLPPGLESLEKWFAYKAEKRDKYTPTGRATLITQQARYPAHFVAASVEKSISNGWKGLFTEKITDAEAAPFLLAETVQWSADEPDFLERMLANRAAAEAREREANAEPEEIQDDGDFS